MGNDMKDKKKNCGYSNIEDDSGLVDSTKSVFLEFDSFSALSELDSVAAKGIPICDSISVIRSG